MAELIADLLEGEATREQMGVTLVAESGRRGALSARKTSRCAHVGRTSRRYRTSASPTGRIRG